MEGLSQEVSPETWQYNTITVFQFCTETKLPQLSGLHFSPLSTCKFPTLLGVSNCVDGVCISFSVHCLVSQLILTVTLCNTSQVPQLSQRCRCKKQINCPARYHSALAVGSFHHPPSLIGVYKGHMAWVGGAVPAQPILTHKTELLPVGRRWMRCIEALALVVPGGSGRGRTRQRWPRSHRSMEAEYPGCNSAAPPAPSLSDRGPIGSKEVGHL